MTEFTKLKDDNDPEEGTFLNRDHESLFPRYLPPKSPSSTPKLFLLFGDDLGLLHLWDLSRFLSTMSACPSQTAKLSYNAKRKEKIDASKVASSYLQQAKA